MKFKFIKRVVAVALSAITLFTMIPTMSITASAASSDILGTDINLSYVRDKNPATTNNNYWKKYQSGWERYFIRMKANGKPVYCVMPELDAPPEGTYSKTDTRIKRVSENGTFGPGVTTKAAWNKVLYYSQGGTRFNDSNFSWKYTSVDNKTRTMKEWMTYFLKQKCGSSFKGALPSVSGVPSGEFNDDTYYALTHILTNCVYTVGEFIPSLQADNIVDELDEVVDSEYDLPCVDGLDSQPLE